MKSRITIDFKGLESAEDLGKGKFEPVIKVTLEESDDVRDSLVKAFFESLQHRSNWLRADFKDFQVEGEITKTITISTIKPGDMESTIETMKSRLSEKE